MYTFLLIISYNYLYSRIRCASPQIREVRSSVDGEI